MSITIANLRTRTLQYINEASGCPWTSDELDRMINKGQRDVGLWLIKVDPSFLTTSTTISRVAGTALYNLPADFVSLRALIDSNDNQILPIHQRTRESQSGYYFQGSQIAMYPDTKTETVTIEYNKFPATISDTSTTSVLPDVCEDMVAIRAAMLLKNMDEETETAYGLKQLYYEEAAMVREAVFMRQNTGSYHIRNRRQYGGVGLT